MELCAALSVSPITDPDQIVGRRDLRQRPIQPGIGGLMPGERPVGPTEPQINLPQHFAEHQDAIEAVQVEARQFVRCSDCAMMCVMEKQREWRGLCSTLADASDQIRRVPFMHNHQIGTVQGAVEIHRRAVLPDLDAGQESLCLLERLYATVANGVEAAPSVGRLIDDHLMTKLTHLARKAPQKMRVSVIPAGCDCMIEQDPFHACTSTA